MERRRINILLELIDDITVKYPDTEEYIQQKLQEKCKREGIPIGTISFRIKNVFTVICKILSALFAILNILQKCNLFNQKMLSSCLILIIVEETSKCCQAIEKIY